MRKNDKISPFLIRRRFRRRLKSKARQKARRCKEAQQLVIDFHYRLLGKGVHNLSDAINVFMPNNLKFLITKQESPICQSKLKNSKFVPTRVLRIPEEFSIILYKKNSYSFFRDLASALCYQNCKQLWLDYSNCHYCDLPTQVFLDSILIDNDKFIKTCQRAGVDKYLRIETIGGKGINEPSLQLMINSVGSPVELINRNIKFKNVIPFKLRHIDGLKASEQLKLGQKELDSSDLIQYVIDCLARFGKTLTQTAKQDLGNVIGETISNAEEHSSLHNRYLIGYMEECNKESSHFGILHLVMMNTGNTIYEKFKNPIEGEPFNNSCLMEMQALSNSFNKKSFFRPKAFTEENLWTLYTLQGGVSSVPPSIRKRGNGTIEFINSFFSLKGSNDVDNISQMCLLSGKTQIDFDGTYRIKKEKNTLGEYVSKLAFNASNNLEEKPDSRYVYHTEEYFPGTLISAKLLINEDDIQ